MRLTKIVLLALSLSLPIAEILLPPHFPGSPRPASAQMDELKTIVWGGVRDAKWFQPAVQSWQRALTIYQGLHDRSKEEILLFRLGMAYRDNGEPAKAISYFQSLLALYQQSLASQLRTANYELRIGIRGVSERSEMNKLRLLF